MKSGKIKIVIRKFILLLAGPVLFAFCLSGCDKFEGEQTIPAYIRIDSAGLIDNPNLEEGVLSLNFSDVWIYVDDQLIGAYELPAEIPVLAEDKHNLKIVPGIKMNGMSGIRYPYYYIKPWVQSDYDFEVGKVKNIYPEFYYYDNTVFALIEDFESSSIALERTNNSDTSLVRYNYTVPNPMYGTSSGYCRFDSIYQMLECATYYDESSGYVFPSGAIVFAEVEFNSEVPITVGLIINKISSIIINPVAILNPTNGIWKKIYVNLTPVVLDNYDAENFNLFIRAQKPSSMDTAELKVDNIKLIYK